MLPAWLLYAVFAAIFVLGGTALFFFTLTRGALLLRSARGGLQDDAAHVYPIYADMRLIRLIDFQPVIAAILLFQYDRLVSSITAGLQQMRLHGKKVLITSCAFGNVIPRVVAAAAESGAARVLIADLIRNELTHAQGKLPGFADQTEYLEENATALRLPDGSVDANVIFFLLHELPHPLKEQVLQEACRVLAPGGKLFLAEFHRPGPWLMRVLSWTYFKVFEPWGLALWDSHDPLRQLEALEGITCTRQTVFFGNFQVLVATKAPLR